MRRVVSRPPEGEPAACFMCGFAVIKGLKTAMSKALPNGWRIHLDAKTCKRLQLDEVLRKEVIKLYGQPAELPTL